MEGDEVPSPEGSSPEDEAGRDERVSEYEKQRLSRIKENRARLEALGLSHLASSLLGPLAKQQSSIEREAKGKRKAAKKAKGDGGVGVDDDEYRPSDEDDGEEDGESSSPSEEQEEEEEDYRPPSSSRRKGKKKNKGAAKVRKGSRVRGNMKDFDVIDNDIALQQAIALSLGGATADPGAVLGGIPQSSGTNASDAGYHGNKDRGNIKETDRKRKSRKGVSSVQDKSRLQLTEDEVVAYFFSFDVAGKGYITLRDLQRIVNAHDYTWTDMEMANMIHSFDGDGDGKLNLDDFRTIVTRCNLMQEPKEC